MEIKYKKTAYASLLLMCFAIKPAEQDQIAGIAPVTASLLERIKALDYNFIDLEALQDLQDEVAKEIKRLQATVTFWALSDECTGLMAEAGKIERQIKQKKTSKEFDQRMSSVKKSSSKLVSKEASFAPKSILPQVLEYTQARDLKNQERYDAIIAMIDALVIPDISACRDALLGTFKDGGGGIPEGCYNLAVGPYLKECPPLGLLSAATRNLLKDAVARDYQEYLRGSKSLPFGFGAKKFDNQNNVVNLLENLSIEELFSLYPLLSNYADLDLRQRIENHVLRKKKLEIGVQATMQEAGAADTEDEELKRALLMSLNLS